MGQDYSYSQPSSSEYDLTSLLEEEAALYADEVESSYMVAEPAQYPPPAEAVTQLGTHNSVDLMAMEEMSDDLQTQLSELKEQGIKSEQKLLKLEKTVVVCLLVSALVLIGLVFIFLRGRASKGTYLARKAYNATVWKSDTNHSLTMNTTPGFVDLHSTEPVWLSGQSQDESAVKERRKWSPKEDKILIGAWLNTSKDAVLSNEQKAGAFWKRIIDYYNASPLLVGTIPRELTQAKQRWSRINADVSKFVGYYDQAMREQKSGENDDDLMKAALDYYFKDQGHKFSMEHAWRELRHDQKWSSAYVSKDGGKDKRKVVEIDINEEEGRPVGVKAAKAASKKKKSGKEEELSRLQGIMEIKQKLSNQKLLDRLLSKKEPLTEMETSLKLKLMSDMLL